MPFAASYAPAVDNFRTCAFHNSTVNASGTSSPRDEWRRNSLPCSDSLSSERKMSPVATWRMMKRGCRASLVHFHSLPLVEGRSREKARALAEILNAYQYDTRLLLVSFAEIPMRIIQTVPGPLRFVAFRRFMVLIA